jgi:two-component system, chemotaxis family, chemotaxis protein CheY
MSVSLSRVRFLVVDDNPHAINLTKTMLRGFDVAHVEEARTLAEARARLSATQIDVVILDYLMGNEEGVTLARYLRTSPDSPAPYVPIIMLTGHADRQRVMAARDAGVNEFCVKPVTPADLLKRIMAVIEHPRQFIRSATYFGPDRRRIDDPRYKGPERRADRRARPNAAPGGR